ncbi:MAG: Flp pilus assembly complex ATPase component TadA [Deltaproteobacteria bacterium]|nr:Flp pilus assembly complex ATPase component TadA [Deltaproteobacteria bacterium]
MLKITLAEKGGADKEFFFEDDEVSVGRVQGNSIVLAKPNVSKRHATLTVRNGKILVSDLKSTNGTYVNGRRIGGSREVGPDDRIYVGDFTIRATVGDRPGDSAPAPLPPTPSEEVQKRPTVSMPSLSMAAALRDVKPMPPMPPDDELSVEAPLDLDVELDIPDAAPASPAPMTAVPVAPEPRQARPARHADKGPKPVSPAMAAWQGLEAEFGEPVAEAVEASFDEAVEPADAVEHAGAGEALGGFGVGHSALSRARVSGFVRRAARKGAAGGDGLMDVLRAVADVAAAEVFAGIPPARSDFDDREWAGLSERVMHVVEELRREDRIPADADPYALTQDILFDFAGLGPLEELLGDETVRGIFVDGLDRIFVLRGSHTERSHRGFVNGATQDRVVTKLLGLAGIPPESAGPRIEGRLPDGTWVLMLRPPVVTGGTVLVIERLSGGAQTLDDLRAAGLLSADAARAVRAATAARRNLLVCGPPRSGKTAFLNAVLRQLPATDRVVLVEERRELSLAQPDVVALDRDALLEAGGADLVPRLHPDVVVLSDLAARDADLLLRLAIGGQRGLMASLVAESADECLRRLQMAAGFANPAIPTETIRAAVLQGVDVIVVMGRRADGRCAVVEVAEVDRASGACGSIAL